MDERITTVADQLRAADSVVAFTGAGISTPSGIPDYRGDDGIWEQYEPMDFHIRRFNSDPDGFWRDRAAMVADVYDGPEPNVAHETLATLETAGFLDGVITQNVDGLHTAAGSDPIEIHGNGGRVVCQSCDRRFAADPYYERIQQGEMDGAPRCLNCEGLLKPDVVLFGEQMPVGPLEAARRQARESDCLLVIGSSLSVEPAASIPDEAATAGSDIVVVNLEETHIDDRAKAVFQADVTDVVPALGEKLLD